MGSSLKSAQFPFESRIRDALLGDPIAYYDLGVFYSTGSGGVTLDMIEAHKWFNLAAVGGVEAAQACRAEISEDMTAREIATAQGAARAWIAQTTMRRAA